MDLAQPNNLGLNVGNLKCDLLFSSSHYHRKKIR